MKSCRRLPVAMALPLFIHLLTLQSGDAAGGRNDTGGLSNGTFVPGKIIVEEVIITGSGNNTRVTANAVAEDPSRIGDGVLSLLSKREIQAEPATLIPSNSDQQVEETRALIINVDDEDELERLKRVIAKYEPQRITTRKAKRKIVETQRHDNRDTSGTSDKPATSTKDLERAYHEVLRNISRGVAESVPHNVAVTLNPYPSQTTTKGTRQIYVPATTIYALNSDGTNEARADADATYRPYALRNRKTKKLLKKYLQPERTVVPSRVPPVGVSRLDDGTADNNRSIVFRDYYELLNRKAKARNASSSELSSDIDADSTARPENRREWDVKGSAIQIPSPSESRSNDSNAYGVLDEKRSGSPADLNVLHLPSKYSRAPRPFTVPRFPIAADTSANIDTAYKIPDPAPATTIKYQSAARSSGNVLPLVLPTELFNTPPARRYVPIKRANRPNSNGNPATVVSATNQPAKAAARLGDILERLNANYAAPYTNAIVTTNVPTIAINGERGPGLADYRAITETPTERIVANTATSYVPTRTSSATYATRQQETVPRVVIREKEFSPKIAVYGVTSEKSDLNANPGLALYNRFASLYSTNPPDIPGTIASDYRDFKQPTSPSRATGLIAQTVSALPYATPTATVIATPRPTVARFVSPASTEIRASSTAKPLAPYYDSGLLVRENADEKKHDDRDNAGSVRAKERSRGLEDDEIAEVAADKSDLGDRETPTDRVVYEIHETPNERREEEDRARDRYRQQKSDGGRGDKREGRRDGNDDGDEKYENSRYDSDEDEGDAGETREGEYVDAGESEEARDRRRYNEYEGRGNDSGEEKRGKYDRVTEVKGAASNDKGTDGARYKDYVVSARNNEYDDRYGGRKSGRDDRYERNRQDPGDEEREGESVARASKDQRGRGQREKYEKKSDNGKGTVYRRKYHRHRTVPTRDSRREEHRREEYSETNPEHVRAEYRDQQQQQQQRSEVEDDQPRRNDGDEEDDGDGKKKVNDHVHGETKEHAHKHEEHKKKQHGGDHKYEEGEAAEHKEEHHGHKGDKGSKGYKVWHENEKAEKGHHDKERAEKEYDEKSGEQKKHEEEDGYHEEGHRGDEGKKTAEFGEKGEHQKGHSTKGEHSVHKKDEYEKKTEFFDEFHEDGDVEKHGEHHHQHESEKGGHVKKGHHDSADHEDKYGKEGRHEEGGHHHEHKGHKVDEGHDHHYDHDEKHGKKEGHEHGKKWSYKKGDEGGDAGGKTSDGHKHNR